MPTSFKKPLLPTTSKTLLLGTLRRDVAAKMLKDKGRELVAALRDALPASWSFLLILGEGPSTAYFSDATREETIKTLRSVLAELEAAA